MAREFGKRMPDPTADGAATMQPQDSAGSNHEEPDTGDVGTQDSEQDFPWHGLPDETACTLAFAHLVKNLPGKVMVDDQVHPETFLAAIGAITGFAAQRALLLDIEETGDSETGSQINLVEMQNGRKFYFGEPLNQMLVPQTDADGASRLWSLAAAAAVTSGLSPSQLPDLETLFANVAGTLGNPGEGIPFVEDESRPKIPVRQVLKQTWPLAKMSFMGKIANSGTESGQARISNWPVIAAYVSNTFIRQVKDVVDPGTALTIVMEAAIYASKLDAAAIEDAAG